MVNCIDYTISHRLSELNLCV